MIYDLLLMNKRVLLLTKINKNTLSCPHKRIGIEISSVIGRDIMCIMYMEKLNAFFVQHFTASFPVTRWRIQMMQSLCKKRYQ